MNEKNTEIKSIGRTFCVGDIHGGYLGLVQVLQKVNFDYDNDKLIALGDVTDGWPDVAESIEELMKIKNLVYLRGNHDDWTLKFMSDVLENGPTHYNHVWYAQGGKATYESYFNNESNRGLVEKHLKFLKDAHIYYLDEENRIFMHAGFDPNEPLIERDKNWNGKSTTYSSDDANPIFFWDRSFWNHQVSRWRIGGVAEVHEDYKEIYIGHTPTINYDEEGVPMNIGNVWNMDTGATYDGRLSLMDIDTKEITQSEPLFELYPDHMGRNGKFLAKREK